MREATGNALLVMMVSTIIGVIMVFFVGSISYSKSYRIKNHIINIIEDNRGWNSSEDEIDAYLADVGYNVRKGNSSCPNDSKCGTAINSTKGYNYCVYSCNSGTYYKVVTYMKFEFPIIGSVLQFPVKGETKSFSQFN